MRRRGLTTLILLAVAILLLVPSAGVFYTDWLWFNELGYEAVFLRALNAQTIVFASTFAAVFLVLFLNLRLARRTLNRPHIVLGTNIDGRSIAIDGRRLTGIAMPVAAVIAVLMAFSAARDWLMWLSYFNAAPFNQNDALFGRDVSFYVFKLPVLQAVRQLALITLGLSLVGSGLYYVLSGSFLIEARPNAFLPKLRLVPMARRHLGLLIAAIFGLIAWGAWQQVYTTLITPSTATVGFGASYTDTHARLPFLWIQLAVLAVGGLLAVVYGFTRRGWPLALAVASYFIVSLAGGIYGTFVQRFVVEPSELDREGPYIQRNIEATRLAYGLNNVEERQISGDAELTAQDIISNAATIENVRLWDHQPLLQTFGQMQEIRTYYDFNSVDNDRYRINGKYRQIMLSARELNSDALQNRSFQTERLINTHGYGLTLGPVNQVTTEGQPVLFIRDMPPVSSVDLKVDQPSIYYGELSNDYVLVKTRQQEFHYPRAGDDNEMTTYDGTGGVPIGSLLRRLLFAIRFATTNILFTDQITAESRILFHRRVADRVRILAPFLTYDRDPYLVIADGRLFWIQDAYTTTANYPYATPIVRQSGPFNYIRNSVKVVVDAFHGSTSFYLAEPGDPLALTIANIFPGLLKPYADMPAPLRAHVRYPEDIFQYQTAVYQTYHMTNPTVFFSKEDQWQIPTLDIDRSSVPMQPYYTIMRLPGEKQPEFIQMLPFTPRLKDNLSAWMVARSDPEHYGKLVVFQFPKQKLVFGPKQIAGLINQDQKISPQVTLWNQQGSQVIWGTLLVIPINESLLYVRPLYLRASEGRIPELKRVIVAYQSRIVMDETLTQALAQLFGSNISAALAPDRLASTGGAAPVAVSPSGPTATPPGPALEPTMAALVTEMRAHWNRADEALRQGNLSLYAEEMKKAKDILARMEKIRK